MFENPLIEKPENPTTHPSDFDPTPKRETAPPFQKLPPEKQKELSQLAHAMFESPDAHGEKTVTPTPTLPPLSPEDQKASDERIQALLAKWPLPPDEDN